MISKREFCTLKDGRKVYCYRIENKQGEYVELLDYGASVQSVVVKDKEGRLGDVVLGADPDRLEECTYLGGTIGRCANRIAYGKYTVDNQEFQLEQNMRGHFLHGASGNYAQKLFTGTIDEEKNGVNFFYRDKGEGGFCCCVDVNFFFSFDDEGKLTMEFRMKTEGTTVLNPTNHTYFNLSGKQDVRADHSLWIDTNVLVTKGKDGLPDGGTVRVEGFPYDFTTEHRLSEAMTVEGYDEFYEIDGETFKHIATLTCPDNGRTMKVYSDMPCLILFLNGKRKPEYGKNGAKYEGYCGICLETGYVPNAVNCPAYRQPVFRAGEELVTKTVYEFLC